MKLSGPIIKLEDNISTDIIISGKHTKTLDMKEMSTHVFECLAEGLYRRLSGVIIVAGENFGMGSSREEAPIAIKEAGVIAIVAKSYARIFFRNSINIGLPLFQADTTDIDENATLEADTEKDYIVDRFSGMKLKVEPLPAIMQKILSDGGLVGHMRKQEEESAQETQHKSQL